MPRSLVTVDLAAIRHNARTLRDVLYGSELWAVVKADGYGHGARDVARAAVEAGAGALCVVTVEEGVTLRRELPGVRIVVMGPTYSDDGLRAARDARLELVAVGGPIPEGVPVHLKLDTGMGRWGLSELPAPGRDVVALMGHFASADSDPAFTRAQLRRFLEETATHPALLRHIANSAGVLRYPEARLDAGRCGITLYGISPFGDDASRYGLRPALRWESELALVRRLAPGQSTGYGRGFVAERVTWIGLVPVGYADGFRRDLEGTELSVAGERCRVVGRVSMDVLAVELPGERAVGTPVTLIGDGVLVEEHARVADTIGYEIVCGLRVLPERGTRRVVDG